MIPASHFFPYTGIMRVVLVLIVIACIIYTAVYVVQCNSQRVRHLPKFLWFILVIVLPVIGMIAWWLFGRPLNRPTPPPLAPDDDPDFLRNL